MHVHVYERIFLALSAIFLVLALAAIGASSAFGGAHLPEPLMRVDPRTVRDTPPFDQPGLRELAPGEYEAVMLAQAWAFTPAELQVPAGSTVHFRIASVDVTHGFMVEGTRVNLTLIPGQVSMASATFRQPGTYLIVCHEYCGVGHHAMSGRVVVQ